MKRCYVLEKEKYWLKFILSGKPEDYIMYSNAKDTDRTVNKYPLYDRCVSDWSEQYR